LAVLAVVAAAALDYAVVAEEPDYAEAGVAVAEPDLCRSQQAVHPHYR